MTGGPQLRTMLIAGLTGLAFTAVRVRADDAKSRQPVDVAGLGLRPETV